MAAYSFHVLFVYFFKIFTLFYKNFVHLIQVYPKYWRLDLTSVTLRYPPFPASLWIYDFIWLTCPSVKSFNRKRHNIDIRIFIRIIYYPINGYPDSKLSGLSIPSGDTALSMRKNEAQMTSQSCSSSVVSGIAWATMQKCITYTCSHLPLRQQLQWQ